MKKPDAIFCSDIHARQDQPTCRTDNFMETQINKYKWLSQLQKKHRCPIFCAGDIFNKAKSPSFLVSILFQYLPKMHVVAGNHDLPNHNMKEYKTSSLHLLELVGKVELIRKRKVFKKFIVDGFSFKSKLKKPNPTNKRKIALIHRYIHSQGKHYKGAQKKDLAVKLMRKMKGYDLIISGDNHMTFTLVDHGGQTLINPGSFTRQTADQDKHKPVVFLWWADDNKFIRKQIPIDPAKKVISRSHIEQIQIRDENIKIFVDQLKTNSNMSFDFINNVKSALAKNKMNTLVRKKIMECIK